MEHFTVRILKAQSPVKYVVMNHSVNEESVIALEEELGQHYRNFIDDNQYSLETIQLNNLVLACVNKKYVRGLCESKYLRTTGISYVIFLLDHGKSVKISGEDISDLKKLPEKFITALPFRTPSIILPDLLPLSPELAMLDDDIKLCLNRCSGNEKWPNSALDFCNDVIKQHKGEAKAEITAMISSYLYEGRLIFGNDSLHDLLVNFNHAVWDSQFEDYENKIAMISPSISYDSYQPTFSEQISALPEIHKTSNSISNFPCQKFDNTGLFEELENRVPETNISKLPNFTREKLLRPKFTTFSSVKSSTDSHQTKDITENASVCPDKMTACSSLQNQSAVKYKPKSLIERLQLSHIMSSKNEVSCNSSLTLKPNPIVPTQSIENKMTGINSPHKLNSHVQSLPSSSDINNELKGNGSSPKSHLLISSTPCFDQPENSNYLKIFRCEHIAMKVWDFNKLDESVVKALKNMGILASTPIQKHSLHAIARDQNVALIGPKSSLTSLSYLTMIISKFFTHNMRYKQLRGSGPLLLILCASFESVNSIFNTCLDILKESNGIRLVNLSSMILTENNKGELLNGCHILITIPAVICNLLSTDDCKLLNKNRLCHLALEDANDMLKRKGISDQLLKILEWRKTVASPQFILCSRVWTREIQRFLSEQGKNPFLIYIADLMQAAYFINMDIVVKTCSIYKKDAELIDILHHLSASKTVVFVSEDNVFHVKDLIESQSLSVIVARHGMSKSEITVAVRNWMCGSSDYIFLMDDITYEEVKISDAKHLIHYDYTSEKTLFHNRFNVLTEAMQSAVRFYSGDLNVPIRGDCSTYMIITDENELQAYFMSRYFKECNKEISPRLEEVARKHEMKKEHRASNICGYLKSFGECTFNSCRGRHIFNLNQNVGIHPTNGSVDLKIVKVLSANHYFAHVIKYYSESKKDFDPLKPYRQLNVRLQMHLNSSSNRIALLTPNVGMLAVIKNSDDSYSRVKLLSVVSNTVTIQNLETAEESNTNVDRLLVLPEKFQQIPAQAVEIILSNIRPVDESLTWQNNATLFTSRLILNVELKGKIIKAYENTIWIDSLKKFNVLTSIKDLTLQFDLTHRLKKEKFAIHNPEHMQLLEAKFEKLINEAAVDAPKERKSQQEQSVPNELKLLEENEITSRSVIAERIIVDSKPNTSDRIQLQTKEQNKRVEKTDNSKSKVASNVSEQRTDLNIQVVNDAVDKKEADDNLKLTPQLRHRMIAKTWAETAKRLKSCEISTEQLELEMLQTVYVSWVNTPSIFYVQKTGTELEELNIEINSSLLQRPTTVMIGKYYLAPFEPDRYFRSQVIKILPNNQVEMFCLDVGDQSVFSTEDLMILETKFLEKLPFQAIPCSMAHITSYKEEAGDELWEQVNSDGDDGKLNIEVHLMVTSKLASKGYQNPMYEVILIDNSRSIILNEYLVRKKLAAQDSTNFSKYWTHLIPESEDSAVCVESDNSLSNHYTPTESPTSDQSVAARILWYESSDEVILKVLLNDVKKYDLNVEKQHVEFSCLLGSRYFCNNMDLLEPVVPGGYTVTVYPSNVFIRLVKQTPAKWFHLLANNYKPVWLKYDMDHIDVSDSDESTCIKLPYSGNPKRINHKLSDPYDLSNSSCSDESYFSD